MSAECVRIPVEYRHDGCDCCAGSLPIGRRTALSGCAGGIAALVGSLIIPGRVARAQSTVTPDTALQALLDGNKRFVAKELLSFQEDLRELKQRTAGGQEPFAAVLSCADSRVPVELIFDQSIGKVFVIYRKRDEQT